MNPLVANTIHDVKNTLTVLSTWLAEAHRASPSEALDEARTTTEKLSAQLVELLAIYRADEASLRLAIADHDLTDFCHDVVGELLLPPGQKQRITIDLAGAQAIGAWAFDAYQVKLVLQDAIRNALRHSWSTVNLSVATVPEGGIRFTVRDDGPGYPPEVLGGTSGPMGSSSSGLGLTFARLIALHHNTPDGRSGQLTLQNDKGAVFSLRLP